MSTDFQGYLKNLQLEQLFTELGAPDPQVLAQTVEHFTTKEAEKRDKIVLSYFGKNGVNKMVNTVAEFLLAEPTFPAKATVLDVGAGTGFFTTKIARKVQRRRHSGMFYAMDATPAMLRLLESKKPKIPAFLGIAENIYRSIREARKHFDIPDRFDAIFSTLMLHHSADPEGVFESIRAALKGKGKAIIIDLCEHTFTEFGTEMGDRHLGFKPENIRMMAQKHFSKVSVERMQGICCESSGRSAELFAAKMWAAS